MKTRTQNAIVATAMSLLVATTALPSAQADIEAVSVFASHVELDTQELDIIQDQVSDEVATEYTAELMADIEQRLANQFEQHETTER